MTSFAHVDYPSEHPGVARAQRAAETLQRAARGFDGTRASASLLLAAIVAALVVIANQMIDTWTEGHMLAAWTVMWAVVFAAIALFALPAKRAATVIKAGWRRWTAARKQAAEDDQLWRLALQDSRVMADLSRAMNAGASSDVHAFGARYF